MLLSITRITGVVEFTVFETITLGVWLTLALATPTFSMIAVIAVGILFVGLVAEALVNNVVSGASPASPSLA